MEIINEKRPKRLYRSRDRVIAGLCSGLADYFNVDVVAIRAAAVLLLFCGTIGFWAYLVAWIIVPMEPQNGRK